jgi:hypothetical protein
MPDIRRLKLRELPYLSKIFRYTLEDGTLTLWLDLGSGEQGLFVTREQRSYNQFAQGHVAGRTPSHALHRGANRVLFVWGDSDDDLQEHVDPKGIEQARPAPSPAVDGLMDAIIEEMEQVWGADGFEGTPSDYAWLLEHYGITEEEDVEWIGILDYYAGESADEEPPTEEWLHYMQDDRAVTAFLARLLQKYRSNTVKYGSR